MIRYIAHLIFNPVVIFWGLFLVGLLLRKKIKRLSSVLLLIAFVWLALLSTPPLPRWLASSLEDQYVPLLDPSYLETDTAIHIVVLGAGHTSDPRLPFNNQLSQVALGRLVEGIRLHQQLPGSKLVLSGYSREGIVHTHAEVLEQTAVMLGVEKNALLLLKTPRNTEEEAKHYAQKYGKADRLILVTSALHMPRAMLHFRRAGLNAVAAPTNHRIKKDALYQPFSLQPSAKNLKLMSAVMHEYGGMIHAWWRYRNR